MIYNCGLWKKSMRDERDDNVDDIMKMRGDETERMDRKMVVMRLITR